MAMTETRQRWFHRAEITLWVLVAGAVLVRFTPPQEVRRLVVDEPAPTFSVRTLDGEKVSLDDLEGDVVLVNFWASRAVCGGWCRGSSAKGRSSGPWMNSLPKETGNDRPSRRSPWNSRSLAADSHRRSPGPCGRGWRCRLVASLGCGTGAAARGASG